MHQGSGNLQDNKKGWQRKHFKARPPTLGRSPYEWTSGYRPDSAHGRIDALPSCNIKQKEPRKTSHNFFAFMLLPDDETIIDCRYDIDFIPPIPYTFWSLLDQ